MITNFLEDCLLYKIYIKGKWQSSRSIAKEH